VRIDHDRCTVSLNTSGVPLHQRGYRLQSGKAPLRENLAAGALLLCGWTSPSAIREAGFQAFYDPMCGSATLAIEAALISRNTAPGLNRSFSFEHFANFEPSTWEEFRNAARKVQLDQPSVPITGSDRNEGATEIAGSNAARAGLEGMISLTPHALSHARTNFERGLLLCNPPYGKRLSQNKDVRNLYASLGQVFREHFSGWKFGLVTSEHKLATSTGVAFDRTSPPLPHGGLRVRLYQRQR
jgi:putative N6-adenine-specific DNA methylase